MADESVQALLARAVAAQGEVATALAVIRHGDGAPVVGHWPLHAPRDDALLGAAMARLGDPTIPAPQGSGIVLRTLRRADQPVGVLALRLPPASASESESASESPSELAPASVPAARTAPDSTNPSPAASRVGGADMGPAPAAAPGPPRPARSALPPPTTSAPPPALAPARWPAPAQPAVDDLSATLLRSAIAAPDLDSCAAGVATELARALAADRVAVGVVARRFARVVALSHGAQLREQQSLAAQIGRAMDEALDQACSIQHPQHPSERARITLAHAELAARQGSAAVLTLPLFAGLQPVGALVMERTRAEPFDAATLQRLESLAASLAPLLMLQLDRQRSLAERWRAAAAARWAALPPARRRQLRWAAPLALLALAAAGAWPGRYEITATTRLEGRVQRALVAPLDGYLRAVHARPGDRVEAGQLLAELSDEELQLERRRAQTEVGRHESAYAEAQARQDRAALVMADARVAEARAQLALVEQQLARTRLESPLDGVVIEGDLVDRLGAPVRRGDALFTLAPTNELRVMLELDERDVGQVEPGARGELQLAALPAQRIGLVVERVTPVARVVDGANIFEAEARLADLPPALAGAGAAMLRPGLQGVAHLDAGERALAWRLTHRLVDWLRLQWWAWAG